MKYIKKIMLLLAVFSFCVYGQTDKNKIDIDILDSNKDGILNPYEILDTFLLLEKEMGKKIKLNELPLLFRNIKEKQNSEFNEMIEAYDSNGDKKISVNEMKGDMEEFFPKLDINKDGFVTFQEISSLDFSKWFLMNEREIELLVDDAFEQFGNPEYIDMKKHKNLEYPIPEWDLDHNKKIFKEEAIKILSYNQVSVSFTVKGTVAIMNGVITSAFPAKILQLVFEHPEVKTIEMNIVPGSIDDVANLRASLYVRKFGLNTKLHSRSSIASGGTDFFLAGVKRTVSKGAKIGVHSWGDTNQAATDFPKDDPVHQKYLEYYRALEIPEEFYWYTLEAAPVSGSHIMTEEEIKKYKIKTN